MNARFDRRDICEAYSLIERHYNVNGWLRERASNQRRKEATHVQLQRMDFNFIGEFEDLSENGQEIYKNLERRYDFITELELEEWDERYHYYWADWLT